MKVLGIDPGIANLGWAVLDGRRVLGCGVIKTQPRQQHDARLYTIYTELEGIVDQYDLFTGHMANERLPYGAKLQAASSIGEVIGVLGLLASFYQMKRFEYSPNAAKKDATGSGKATKDDIIRHARDLGWDGPLVEHSADAIAIAAMHIKAEGR